MYQAASMIEIEIDFIRKERRTCQIDFNLVRKGIHIDLLEEAAGFFYHIIRKDDTNLL
jgi:hypothetical protein